jgi:thiamine biosynthesis lipoprotein
VKNLPKYLRKRLSVIAPAAALLLFCSFRLGVLPGMQLFRIKGSAQGTTYSITYFAPKEKVKKVQIDSIFRRLDESLSIYKTGSLINRFNESESETAIDGHFYEVVRKALEITQKTDGAFDITVYPLVRAWGFGMDEIKNLPDSAQVKAVLGCVGSGKLTLKKVKLSKANPCTKIDVNGIAQGYSVDVVADFLEANSIRDYLVEVGGEIRVKGLKYPEKEQMAIGIETPAENEFERAGIQKVIMIGDRAVTTSGSYRKFREVATGRISHVIDPHTGFPAQTDIISATVVAKDALTADGYDNALLVMGLRKALTWLANRPDLQAYFIYKKPNGMVSDTATANFYPYVR